MAIPTLGAGFNSAVIYDRLGRGRLLPIDRAKSIEWGRALCDFSTAAVTIAGQHCTPRLDEVHTWAHSLVVFRGTDDGPAKRVWEGPIQKIESDRGDLKIAATDVAGWTQVRPIETTRLLTSTVRDEMVWTIQQAFLDDDPNVLAYLQTTGTLGGTVDRDIQIGAGYHSADLESLVQAGGRWTVIGRRIIVWCDEYLGRLRTLRPEDHLTSDVKVIEDGRALLTSALVRDDTGNVVTYEVAVGGVDPFYGKVGGILSSGQDEESTASLTNRAEFAVQSRYPARQTLVVPDGSTLICDSPFPIEALVPGTLIPVVTTTATGRTIRATMMLAAVNVTQGADGAEKVGITVTPVPSGV